jgi:uncharacterized protein Yka (UPF0111/DUF47 family)
VTEDEIKALLARVVDAIVMHTTSADHLRSAVGELTDAVTALARQVAKLERRIDDPAE